MHGSMSIKGKKRICYSRRRSVIKMATTKPASGA